MMKRTIKDAKVSGKKLIIRCDFNVPLDENGNITDEKRINSSLQTINYALENDAAVILMSHLGRPKGEYKKEFSLKPVAEKLSEKLGKEIFFISSETVISDDIKKTATDLKNGEILLLENLRFRKEEETGDETFAKELANLADIYINDAFGTAHRAHASTAIIAKFLPSYIGFLMEKEVKFLGDTLENPKRPFLAILGGAKVSDKIKVIESLLDKVNSLIIGGGMAYTFIKGAGSNIGKSLVDESALPLIPDILKKARAKNVNILIPIDTVSASTFNNDADIKIVASTRIPDNYQGLDIGPKTTKLFVDEIKHAKTVFWNGPMGVFEMPNFAEGTKRICEALANSSAISIIGGGDSAAAAKIFGYADKMTHISTGGGASLEFIEKGNLPGLEVIPESV
ncbi:MAG: phosphoglycerate kinase [Clostridiales Family XIII bacterium]|nr:phosphoglycerate kinase [Clostridiales Family XIII bacterium]